MSFFALAKHEDESGAAWPAIHGWHDSSLRDSLDSFRGYIRWDPSCQDSRRYHKTEMGSDLISWHSVNLVVVLQVIAKGRSLFKAGRFFTSLGSGLVSVQRA